MMNTEGPAGGAERGNPVLEVSGVDKRFGGVHALNSVALSLAKGEVLGVVGENGAGKSTLMNVLSGVVLPDTGEMHLLGEKYSPRNPKDAERRGIALIHQELSLFLNLTVEENICIDDFPKRGIFRAIDRKRVREIAIEALEELDRELNPRAQVETLRMGHRQVVEIAKAIQKNAGVLIFDEPTTSLSSREKQNLFRLISDLRSRGKSIIYISHILEDVFSLCDRVVVMRDGEVVGDIDRESVTPESVIRLMVGKEFSGKFPDYPTDKEIGEPVLAVNGLCVPEAKIENLQLTVRRKEVVGVFGMVGAGRSEFARAIFGVDDIASGEVLCNGEPVTPLRPDIAINHGIAFLTENRRNEGLFMPLTLQYNLTSVCLERLGEGPLSVINESNSRGWATRMVEQLSIKTPGLGKSVALLSGGNQQKAVLGKWLMQNPAVLILDEPTKGVDVGAKLEIYSLIHRIAQEGTAVLMISSEYEELLGVCDRIIVMHYGRVVIDLNREDFDEEAIMMAAVEGKAAK